MTTCALLLGVACFASVNPLCAASPPRNPFNAPTSSLAAAPSNIVRVPATDAGVVFTGRTVAAAGGTVLFDHTAVSFSITVVGCESIVAHMSQEMPVCVSPRLHVRTLPVPIVSANRCTAAS